MTIRLSRHGTTAEVVEHPCRNHFHLGAEFWALDLSLIAPLGRPLYARVVTHDGTTNPNLGEVLNCALRDPDNEPSIIAFASNLIEEVEL